MLLPFGKKLWRQLPSADLLFPLILGMSAASLTLWDRPDIVYGTMIGFVVLLLILRLLHDVRKGILVVERGVQVLLCFCCGYMLYTNQWFSDKEIVPKKIAISGRVESLMSPSKKNYRVIVYIDSASPPIPHQKMLIYLQKGRNSSPLPDDRLEAVIKTFKPSVATDTARFDMRSYLRYNNIFYCGMAWNRNWRCRTDSLGEQWTLIHSLRRTLVQRFTAAGVSPEALGVLTAMAIGRKDLLHKEVREEFIQAGSMHILAVSGLHVGLIVIFLFYLTYWLRFWGFTNLHGICIISGTWLYAWLTGFSPSVVRAASLVSIYQSGLLLKRIPNPLNTLLITAVIIIVVNPFQLFQVGFQLSYGAVAGILLFLPLGANLIAKMAKWQKYFLNLIFLSIAVQLAIFPLTTYYFKVFPLYFMVSGILTIPLAGIILYTLLLGGFLLWSPFLSDLAFYLAGLEVELLLLINKWIAALPFSSIRIDYYTPLDIVIHYLIIGLLWQYAARSFYKKNH